MDWVSATRGLGALRVIFKWIAYLEQCSEGPGVSQGRGLTPSGGHRVALVCSICHPLSFLLPECPLVIVVGVVMGVAYCIVSPGLAVSQ